MWQEINIIVLEMAVRFLVGLVSEQMPDSLAGNVRECVLALAPETNSCDVSVTAELCSMILLCVAIIAVAVVVCTGVYYWYKYSVIRREKSREEKVDKEKLEAKIKELVDSRTAEIKKQVRSELEQQMNLTAQVRDIMARAEELSRHGHDVRVSLQNGPYKIEIKSANSEE